MLRALISCVALCLLSVAVSATDAKVEFRHQGV